MPAAAKDTFLKACRAVYAMAAPPVGVTTMPTLYLDDAPETTGYPRAIIVHEGETPNPDSFGEPDGNAAYNEARVTIHLMSENDSDLAEDLATSVRSVFSPESLNLTFDQNARIFRTGYKVSLAGIRSPADNPVYVASISYKGVFGTDD